MTAFVPIARADEMSNGEMKVVELEDRLVLLIRQADTYYCIDDVCTHDGGPLGEGDLDGHQIACPRHGARFDIRTGQALTMPATEATRTYRVRVVDGDIQIALDE